jgi:hypothetical protein
MICLAALPNNWPTAILAWYPPPTLFYPLPLFFTPPALLFPLPQPLPQVEGAHTPPLAGESERASDPVGGVLPQFLPPPCTTLFCSLESPHATRHHTPRLY